LRRRRKKKKNTKNSCLPKNSWTGDKFYIKSFKVNIMESLKTLNSRRLEVMINIAEISRNSGTFVAEL
jgi:hypothetical protein